MHDPYDDEDDGYNDDYYDHDYDNPYDPYKFYFKFEMNNTPLSDWITKMINDIMKNPTDENFNIINIPGFKAYSFPVNSWNPNTANDKKFQYLGSNYAGEPIWKSKYWIVNPINQEYKAHLQSHASHFIQQPNYYRGLFDILN